jgi:hypothetical protein
MHVKRVLTYGVAAIFVVALAFVLASGKEEGTNNSGKPGTVNRYVAPPVPDSFSFCGEKVPLERQDIREQFDREVVYNYFLPNNIIYIIKLSHRYFPMIESKLKAHGIPTDMKYLCVAESNLQNLISRVGATGFWQFMKGTAPAYGLEVNSNVDERYHVEKSTDAACQYLKAAYAKFGSWTAAAASYNCGQGGYNMHSNFQRTDNYYDLLLPEETNRYIFRILTFKYFMSNADQLGFVVTPSEAYAPLETRTVTVTQSISNLVDFAGQQGVTYRTLKKYNPWLRGKSLPVKGGKIYHIQLPRDAQVAKR